MKITEKELKKMIREAVENKLITLYENKKNEKQEISEEWVSFLSDVDSLISETIDKSKDLIEKAEKIKENERSNDSEASFVKTRKADEYKIVNERMQFIKNLVTKLSSVNFDMSTAFYKGKV